MSTNLALSSPGLNIEGSSPGSAHLRHRSSEPRRAACLHSGGNCLPHVTFMVWFYSERCQTIVIFENSCHVPSHALPLGSSSDVPSLGTWLYMVSHLKPFVLVFLFWLHFHFPEISSKLGS